jgi:CheY-like chemotaxis protein
MTRQKAVLVVDDDRDLRETLADVLGDQGYRVSVASDGLEALDLLRMGEKPAVILLDWMMPRCDGAQFREQQTNDPSLADIPVVLLSADTRVADKTRRVNAQEYLAKPVQLDHLLEVIEKYCA